MKKKGNNSTSDIATYESLAGEAKRQFEHKNTQLEQSKVSRHKEMHSGVFVNIMAWSYFDSMKTLRFQDLLSL
jgi:hypothetical protein